MADRLGRRGLFLVGCVGAAALLFGGIAYVATNLFSGAAGPPRFVTSAPAHVRAAYDYAVGHPEVLSQVTCFCGCMDGDHKSNLDCFIDGVTPKGEVRYDPMGSA